MSFDKCALIRKVSYADLGNKMLSAARRRKAELAGRPSLGGRSDQGPLTEALPSDRTLDPYPT